MDLRPRRCISPGSCWCAGCSLPGQMHKYPGCRRSGWSLLTQASPLLLPLRLSAFTNTRLLFWALKTIILSVKKKPSPLCSKQQSCVFWIIWVLPFILISFHLLLPFQEWISHLSPSPLLVIISSSLPSFIPHFSFCLPAPPHLLLYLTGLLYHSFPV